MPPAAAYFATLMPPCRYAATAALPSRLLMLLLLPARHDAAAAAAVLPRHTPASLLFRCHGCFATATVISDADAMPLMLYAAAAVMLS